MISEKRRAQREARARNCVTHHHACDCREWETEQVVARLREQAERLTQERNAALNLEAAALERVRQAKFEIAKLRGLLGGVLACAPMPEAGAEWSEARIGRGLRAEIALTLGVPCEEGDANGR